MNTLNRDKFIKMNERIELKLIETQFSKPTRNLDRRKRLYDKMEIRHSNKFIHGSNFVDDISHIKKEVAGIKSFLESFEAIKQISIHQGGDYVNEETLIKIHSIDNRLTRTETLVEQISNQLNRMESKMETLATKDFVTASAGGIESTLLKWIIGTGLGVAAVVIGIIKLF